MPFWKCVYGTFRRCIVAGGNESQEAGLDFFYSLHLLPIYSLLPDCGQNVTSYFTFPQLCLLHHDGLCVLKL